LLLADYNIASNIKDAGKFRRCSRSCRERGYLKKCQLGKEICKSTDREDEVGITVKVSFTQH
jgi:hypothetical protein